MPDIFPEFSWHVLRSSVFLSIASLVALGALRVFKTSSARTSALTWTMVLVAGVLLVPAKLEIPWYEPVLLSAADEQSFAAVHRCDAIESAMTASRADGTPAFGAAQPSFNRFFWWTAYPAAWLLGAVGIGMIAAVGYLGLLIALRCSWKPQRTWQDEYDIAAAELNVSAAPQMIVHRHLGPFLWLTPKGYRLVVPSDQWTSLTPAERIVILKHELAHMQRGDVWRSLPIRLVVLRHWFNPLSWLAARRLEEAAEWEADRIATDDAPAGAAVLANALLKLSQSTTRTRLLAPAARGRSLTKRLKNLIHKPEQRGTEPMLKKLTVVMVLACVLVAAAVQVNLVAQEERDVGERSRVTLATAKQFAQHLVGNDELTNSLRKALQTEPSALILRDRAGHYEEKARNDLREVAIPGLVEKWFETTEAGLKLRSNQDEFRDEYLQAAAAINDLQG